MFNNNNNKQFHMENGRGDNNYYNSIIIMLHNKTKTFYNLVCKGYYHNTLNRKKITLV